MRFVPPLVLMAVIFALSAQPDLNSGLGSWDTILRKCAHMLEYGLLWFLWWRALGREGEDHGHQDERGHEAHRADDGGRMDRQ
jgi:hypothetical protein